MGIVVGKECLCLCEVGEDMLVVVFEGFEGWCLQGEFCGVGYAVSFRVDGNLLGVESHQVEVHEGSQGEGLTTVDGGRIGGGTFDEGCVEHTVDVGDVVVHV